MDKGCPACQELSKIYDPAQKLMLSCFHSQKEGSPYFILTQGKDDGTASGVVISVNFCPWCGRSLIEGVDYGKGC